MEEVQGIRSVNGRYKKDREVRTAEEMEKPKNLCVRTTHGRVLSRGNAGGWRGAGQRGIKRRKELRQM